MQSAVNGHFNCFHFFFLLATANTAAMNMSAQMFLWQMDLISFAAYSVELLDHLAILLQFGRNLYIVLQNDGTNSHSYSVKGLPLLYMVTNMVIFCLFDSS